MVARGIDHAVHQRDIRQLGGLRAAMPVTLAAAVLCGLSMVGVLSLFGFVAKELYYESVGHAASFAESRSIVDHVPGSFWVSIFVTVAVTSNVLLAMVWVLAGGQASLASLTVGFVLGYFVL